MKVITDIVNNLIPKYGFESSTVSIFFTDEMGSWRCYLLLLYARAKPFKSAHEYKDAIQEFVTAKCKPLPQSPSIPSGLLTLPYLQTFLLISVNWIWSFSDKKNPCMSRNFRWKWKYLALPYIPEFNSFPYSVGTSSTQRILLNMLLLYVMSRSSSKRDPKIYELKKGFLKV